MSKQKELLLAEALRHRASSAQAQPEEMGFAGGLIRSLGTEITRNVLNTPEAFAKTGAGMAASGRLPFPFSMIPAGIEAVTGENPHEVGGKAYLSPGRILPEVTPEEAFAGVRMALTPRSLHEANNGVQAAYDKALAIEEGITERAQREAPIGTAVGDVLADGVTLFMGRLPLSLKGSPQMAQVAENTVKAQTTVPGILKGMFTSGPVKKLARGAGRAGETSLEAATLTFLNDPETSPQEAAAVAGGAAAGQALGSAGLQTLSLLKGPARGFVLGASALMFMDRTLQEFSPGENNIFDSIDDTFNNIAYGAMLGMAGAVAGAGRIKPENASKVVRLLADGLTSIPRGAAISVLKEMATDEDGQVRDVLGKVSQSPSAFTSAQIKRLERAVMNEKVSVRSEVAKMMENEDFRTRVGAINSGSQLGGVPQSD